MSAGTSYESLQQALSNLGLLARGGFALEAGELGEFGLPGASRSLVMVGNAGPGLWASLSLLLTYDRQPNPLDRWTRRVLEKLAAKLGATVVFPFGGPPYLPFQRWAQRAEAVFPSPIGPLIHPDYGLWHAYRGALLFTEALDLPPRGAARSPCESCAERPCESTCPVDAFRPGHYAVDACAAHLAVEGGADCLGQGCRARRACPVGQRQVYEPIQAQFHMQAFLSSRA